MKTKYLILLLIIVAVAVVALFATLGSRPNERQPHPAVVEQQVTPRPDTATVRVPAHYEQPPSLSSLGPTLSPEQIIAEYQTQ
jgi:hypothetical protein